MPAHDTTPAEHSDTVELARLRAALADMLNDYKGTPCGFWACHGVTDEIVPMATCHVCAMQIEIKALLADTRA
jgi:hypothetical protein